jgi:hypothetical protein
MNSIVTNGVIMGGDLNNNTPPRGFPAFTETNPDYRKAAFSDREGYMILDTIRRYNGGAYAIYDAGQGTWRFRRWQPGDQESYVDLVFKEIDAIDVPKLYRP